MKPDKSMIGVALMDAIVSPSAAFTALRTHLSWAWAALLILVTTHLIGTYSWLGPMSPEWIVEQQLASANLPPAQENDARAMLIQVAPHAAHLTAISGIFTLITITLMLAAFYFLGERILSQSRTGYGAWFAAASWSLLPLAINSLGLAILSLLADHPNQTLDTVNYASLNNILLHLPIGHSHYILAGALSLFYIWTAALGATAVRVWANVTWSRALAIGFLPYTAVFGIGWIII